MPLQLQDPEGRLYNVDLKPAEPHERKWSTYSLFSLWMNDAHNAGNYTFAAGLFLMGLSPIQVTLGILGGALIIFGGCCMSGFMGHDTGAPYPVVSPDRRGGSGAPTSQRSSAGRSRSRGTAFRPSSRPSR